MRNWFTTSPLFDAAPSPGGGSDTIQVQPGVPYEHSQDPEPEAPKPAKESPEAIELKAERARAERAEKRAEQAEEDAKYWASRNRAPSVVDRPAPTEDEPAPRKPAAAAEKPEKLLDDMSTEGLEALKKRGFITGDQLKEILAEQAKSIRGEITTARTDAEFGMLIKTEFPEIAADSARVSKGERAQTELFKLAGDKYREAVDIDPKLEGSTGLLYLVAKQAKAELAAKAKEKGKTDDDEAPVNGRDKEDKQESRRRRIDAQRPERAAANEESDGEAGFSQMQMTVMKNLGVKPEDFKKHAVGGTRNGR